MTTTESLLLMYMILFMVLCILFARRYLQMSKKVGELKAKLAIKEDELIKKVYVHCPCCGRKLEDK